MKKNHKLCAFLLAVMILTVSALTGCSSGPTAKDAQDYVKAVLDMMCLGDYDHSVKLSDIEEGKETEIRDAMIDDSINEMASDLSDDVKAEFKDVMIEAFSKAKYTVGEATKTDDGGYDVKVTIEPLKIFAGLDEKMKEESQNLFPETEDTASLTQTEINDRIYSLMAKLMREGLKSPTYADPQEVVVHYGLLDKDKKLYGVSEEDGSRLGELLFSAEMD